MMTFMQPAAGDIRVSETDRNICQKINNNRKTAQKMWFFCNKRIIMDARDNEEEHNMKGKGKKEKVPKTPKAQNTGDMKIVSIKVKLLGTIIPVVTCVIFVLILTSYLVSKGMMKESAENLLQSSSDNQVAQIEDWMQENLSSFEMVKKEIEGTHPDDAQIQKILDLYYGSNSNYPEGLYLASSDGTMIKPEESSKADSGFMDAAWFKEGLTRVNMAFGSPYQNEAGESIVSAAGILDDGGETLRVLAADVPLAHISLIVNSMVEMDHAEAVLIDLASDTVLAGRDSSRISTQLTTQDSDPLYAGIAGILDSGDFSMQEIAGCLVSFSEISGTDWVLVSDVPTETIYSDLNRLRTIMIVIGCLAILCIIVLIERMVHIVIRPVKTLTQDIIRISEGDFTVQVRTKGNDEIAAMGQSVQKFVASMREMIRDIHDISDKLGGQADGSSRISKTMYDASIVQSDSMKKMNTTVDQLSSSVNEIAKSATTLAMVVADTKDDSVHVDENMKKTVAASMRGKEDIQRVGDAMKEIGTSIGKLEEAVNKVGHASEEITDIVVLIGNIADETNLLSLNASIEAARAGEAGKGFAVVATEIGKLANTSAESVSNIDQLIREVNVLVQDTVTQTRDSAESIRNSSELIDQAVVTFNEIFDGIEQTDVLIKSMIEKVGKVDSVATDAAAISEEQAASTDEILMTAENMVTQSSQITKDSEEVADGAEALAATSEELGHHVQAFKF